MFGLWIPFLDYQVVKFTILFIPLLIILLIFLRLITCFKSEGALSAPERAKLSFSSIVRLFGVPKMVLHNHD